MKKNNKISIVIILIISLVFVFTKPNILFAATTPSLGTAGTFGILSSTFTRNIGITVITGDAGYTTLSGGGTDTVSGTTFTPAPSQAGTDQATALSLLSSQLCTFTFAAGPIDLSTDTTHGTAGVYTPGVYCTGAASAASIGTGGIILNGNGTFIFRINGALTTVDNSLVTLTGGASACNVFWTPTAATTLGANTTFLGTVIDDSGITVGNITSWIGRALSFGGTVTTDTNTISVPTCLAPANINIVKIVINDNGGTKAVADFPLFVGGIHVVSGVSNTFSAGTYAVTETNDSNYTQTFSGDCDVSGNLILAPGGNKLCTIINDDIFHSRGGGGGLLTIPTTPPIVSVVANAPSPSSVMPIVQSLVSAPNIVVPLSVAAPVIIPSFPKTGFPPEEGSTIFPIIVISGISLFSIFLYFAQKKQTI